MERINQICNDFSFQLQRLRVRNHEERPFYPNGTARDVFRVNEEWLNELFRSVLPHSSDRIISELVRRILRSASTILGVILRIRPTGDAVVLRQFADLLIEDDVFLEHPRLTDEDLPISLAQTERFTALANDFFDTQFQFCAITLRKEGNVAYQDYLSQCPLPYKEQERIGGGAFGEVYKVKIERGHLRSRGDRTGNLEEEWLARKDFKRQQSFTIELHALKEIMEKPQKHNHLVMILAILQCHDTNSLFFPLADCDLHQYLNGKYLQGRPTPVTLEEKSIIFSRGVALAGALAFLHGGLGGTVCLHLDLKPNNVLVYNAYHPEKEIWKITDFGLTRVRNREYSSVAPGVQGIYLPPECGASDGKVTTQSDVWSLGCIFSLVITYMSYGFNGVRKFTEKRGERPEGDFFYVTARNSTPRVSPAVIAWFDQLKKRPSRDERETRLIRETLDYLLRNVLHPIRSQRALAKDVELSLRSIHDSCIHHVTERSPSLSQEKSKHPSLPERLLSRLRHRASESAVSRLRNFRYDLGTNGYGFRFSPVDGDFLAFFSCHETLVWTVSEIMSALDNGSQIPPPRSLRVDDSAIKSFAISSNTICVSLDGDFFQCLIYSTDGPSSSVRVDDGVKVSYDHMGSIKKVSMSPDSALAAFVTTDKPKGSESDCRIYLAYTQHLMDTADGGPAYPFPRTSRADSVSDSSLMSITTAANLIFQKISVGPAAQVKFLDFTLDGRFLVIVTQDGPRGLSIRVWETYNGKCYKDFSVAIENAWAFENLFTACCLFVTKAEEPCLVVVSDHRRILHINLATRTFNDRRLDVDVDSMFVCDDGNTLVLIGKKHGLRAYLLRLNALEKSNFFGIAKINRLPYDPALDDAAVRRDANGHLKLLIASSCGSFLDMGINTEDH